MFRVDSVAIQKRAHLHKQIDKQVKTMYLYLSRRCFLQSRTWNFATGTNRGGIKHETSGEKPCHSRTGSSINFRLDFRSFHHSLLSNFKRISSFRGSSISFSLFFILIDDPYYSRTFRLTRDTILVSLFKFRSYRCTWRNFGNLRKSWRTIGKRFTPGRLAIFHGTAKRMAMDPGCIRCCYHGDFRCRLLLVVPWCPNDEIWNYSS